MNPVRGRHPVGACPYAAAQNLYLRPKSIVVPEF